MAISLYGLRSICNRNIITLIVKKMKKRLSFVSLMRIWTTFESEVMPGFNKYCDIVRQFGNETHVFMTGSGKGDIYILCSYYDEYLRRKGLEEKSVLIVTGNSGATVAGLFGIENIEVISVEETKALIRFFVFSDGTNAKIEILHHHIITRHTGILMWLEGLNGLDFASCTRETVFSGIENTCIKKPTFSTNDDFIDDIFKQYGFKVGLTVLLCPYANSVKKLPNGFWEDIAFALLEKGYCVCTNSIGDDEPPIKGTQGIFIPYQYSVPFLERAGYVVSLRSGFNDIICSAQCKMVILYPDKDFKRGLAATLNTRESFSIRKMYGRLDVVEIDVGILNKDEVINDIISTLGS